MRLCERIAGVRPQIAPYTHLAKMRQRWNVVRGRRPRPYQVSQRFFIQILLFGRRGSAIQGIYAVRPQFERPVKTRLRAHCIFQQFGPPALRPIIAEVSECGFQEFNASSATSASPVRSCDAARLKRTPGLWLPNSTACRKYFFAVA